MTVVSFRVIDGPERGKVFDKVPLPVTIGREKGNSIVLEDDRISRCHLKIFEESGLMLLIDLDSTNGTRVNGETTMIWSLRPGDLVTIGNTFLVFGTRTEIIARLAELRRKIVDQKGMYMGITPAESPHAVKQTATHSTSEHSLAHTSALMLQNELFDKLSQQDLVLLRALFPPELPNELSADQSADLSKFLLYFCLRLRTIVDGVRAVEASEVDVRDLNKRDRNRKSHPRKKYQEKDSRVTLAPQQWQNLLDVYDMFSQYIDQLTKPGDRKQ